MVVLTADAAFEQSAARDLRRQRADRSARGLGHDRRRRPKLRPSTARPSSSSISTPAATSEMQALERLMPRIGGWPPVVVVDAELRRRRGAHAAADAGRGLPGEAGVAGRAGAHLRARRARTQRDARRTEARDLHLPAGRRRRRRHHACDPDRDAAAQQRPARQAVDLPGRSRFPARRLRRLSRPRAAARSRARSSRGRNGSTASCWR